MKSVAILLIISHVVALFAGIAFGFGLTPWAIANGWLVL